MYCIMLYESKITIAKKSLDRENKTGGSRTAPTDFSATDCRGRSRTARIAFDDRTPNRAKRITKTSEQKPELGI
ncbi:hypothetical protein KAH81_09890 [bacterium]|nr:hypothetical protein [bacterium]